MVISGDLRSGIQEKAELYDATKNEIKAGIENNIKTAIKILKSIKSELIDEIDREFGRNPFTEFLSHDNSRTDADAERLLAEQKIPENHGPNEKTFSALFRAIDSLRAWRVFTPKNLKVKNITWDSITLSWDKVSGASFYQVEMDGNEFWDAPTTNIFTKRGLLPRQNTVSECVL